MKEEKKSKAEIYQENFRRILSEVYNILSEQKYYFRNMDDDFGASNDIFLNKCCEMTEGLLEYKNISTLEQEREWAINEIVVTSNQGEEVKVSYKNYGINLYLNGVAKALNKALKFIGYSGEKYFCDISLEVDWSGIGFVDFLTEKAIVDRANLFRGFGKEDPMDWGYYYEKLNEYEKNFEIE